MDSKGAAAAVETPDWYPHEVHRSTGAESRLNFRGFLDQLPQENVDYFTPTPCVDHYCGLTQPPPMWHTNGRSSSVGALPKLCIGMAFYNEEPQELRRTLVSLADQAVEMSQLAECSVVLVSDGHTQMHPDTKKFLRALFCNNANEESHFNALLTSLDVYAKAKADADEDERINTAVASRKQPPPPLTYVLQRVTSMGTQDRVRVRGAKDGNEERFLTMSLVLKSLNRRKHNSQEWMFAFARQQRVPTDFLFLTDCGTFFERGCLLRLVAYMRDNQLCMGCTGRQRVMSAAEQDCEYEGLSEGFFRLVQTADYEGSYATYTGAFSLIGCLPVLPGPCCMLRYSALSTPRAFRSPDPLEDILKGGRRRIHTDCDFEDPFIGLGQDSLSVELNPARPSQETLLEHFTRLVATSPTETSLVIENVKLAEDRIPSYALITHGARGAYTTWVDGAIFYFQAETSLEAFVKQRRRWINGALFSYVWLALIKSHLILQSSHNWFRRYTIWVMFLVQLFTYTLAMISPAIFGSGFYLGVISLSSGEGQTIILAATILFGIYTWAFVWVHRYQSFVKPLFFFMMFLNMIAMILTIAGYIRQAVDWNFSPSGIDRQIIQWATIAIILTPFVMALVALNFKSLWLLFKSCIPYWLFLPTLVGSFTLYGMARLSDTSWGNRVTVSGSSFKAATQHELAQLQLELSSNSLVALIFLTALNITIECFVIYYGVNTWFILGVLVFIFSTTLIQATISIVYFVGKHLSGLTCWEKFGCCLCCRRRLSYRPDLMEQHENTTIPMINVPRGGGGGDEQV